MLSRGEYRDNLSKTDYKLDSNIELDRTIYHITGGNGAGKSRFIEGVLLKELKKQQIRMLYFSQDIENQILSFELIDLVKNFIDLLKKSGKFFKTIFLNDDAHVDIALNFDEQSVLRPNRETILQFILREIKRYSAEVIIFDEVDKYFSNEDDFINLINKYCNATIFIVSHIISSDDLERKAQLQLLREGQEVTIVKSCN